MVCGYIVLKLIHEAIKNFVVIAEHPAHLLKEFMGKVAEVIFLFPPEVPHFVNQISQQAWRFELNKNISGPPSISAWSHLWATV